MFLLLSLLQHSILKPFMLRRVKTDVISELTSKTEVTVHCKLSSRQQAFYQAIKNKISLAELFDGNRGHLNEKKILNLMNIVIQLRKVFYQFYWVLFHLSGKMQFIKWIGKKEEEENRVSLLFAFSLFFCFCLSFGPIKRAKKPLENSS